MIPKFRAWDKRKNIMRDVTVLHFNKDGTVHSMQYWSDSYDLKGMRYKDVELMQSTGLKDKNDVEIFEGDVLKETQNLNNNFNTPKLIKGVVNFSKRNTMFYLEESDYKDHSIFMNSLGNSIYQYEIIGNIYNNPELLTGA